MQNDIPMQLNAVWLTAFRPKYLFYFGSSGEKGKVVRVGQGNIAERLTARRQPQ